MSVGPSAERVAAAVETIIAATPRSIDELRAARARRRLAVFVIRDRPAEARAEARRLLERTEETEPARAVVVPVPRRVRRHRRR